MGAARLDLPRESGLRFWKLCGSGSGEGFTPRPNWGVYAILGTWDDPDTARDRTANGPVWKRWRAHAEESVTIFLSPTSVRGQWSGTTPFTADEPEGPGPLAAMTRATVRPKAMLRFWAREPLISDVIGNNPDVVFKIGIGEVPLLQQVTFSIWPDADSMARFARGDTAHGRAIRAVRDEGWFREELYARFRVLGSVGTWNGVDPLARLSQIETAA